ncbi:MAG: HAD family hydrolase [bacterium]
MSDPVQQLRDLNPQHDYFIGIDSDGCAFDSMELKHKECFCPNFIKHFGLQAVSKYARETWDFVNLYSKTRGYNRFKAVLVALDLLRERTEVQERGVRIPEMQGLREWIRRESKLGNPALEAELQQNPDPDLELALQWSHGVNRSVEEIVFNLPPFPYLTKSLQKLQGKADVIVVSQTPLEALQREWQEHDIDGYTRLIAGQEMGTKSEHIALAADGKYPPDHILMIGDAPGDLRAAQSNRALFYPIIPGREEQSWQRFYEEGLKRFLSGTFKGEYEQRLAAEFDASLPEKPSWDS